MIAFCNFLQDSRLHVLATSVRGALKNCFHSRHPGYIKKVEPPHPIGLPFLQEVGQIKCKTLPPPKFTIHRVLLACALLTIVYNSAEKKHSRVVTQPIVCGHLRESPALHDKPIGVPKVREQIDLCHCDQLLAWN